MRSIRTVGVVVFLLLALVSGIELAFGQRGGRLGRENLRLSGSLQALRPGFLQVASDEGIQWVVRIQAKPQDIHYQATAEPEWVRPGMLVRFSGRFNKQGQAEQPITEITVFTPREGNRLGIFPESTLNTEGLFEAPDAESQPSSGFASYLVSGRFMGFKAGKMAVAAGRTPLQVDVSDEVEVQVDVSDYSLARPGDKVELSGWYLRGQPGKGIADKVSITAAEPLAAENLAGRSRQAPGEAVEQAAESPAEGPSQPGAVPAEKGTRP